MTTHYILFKVFSVSTTTNSFGLRGHLLMSRTGLVFEVSANYLNSKPRGSIVKVPVRRVDLRSPETLAGAVAMKLGAELPRVMPKAPPAVIRKVFEIPVPTSV